MEVTVAALSIVATCNSSSRAEVIGEVCEDNVEFLATHLRELTGDVTLDCHRAAFLDPQALMLLVDFEEFLHERGNRLFIDGVPQGGDAAHPGCHAEIRKIAS